MSFQSNFTGNQMEEVFRKITDMVTGTVEITASITGFGYTMARDIAFGGANPKVFASVRGIDETITDVAGVSPVYNPEAGTLFVRLYGAGIRGGKRYAVDYMIIE